MAEGFRGLYPFISANGAYVRIVVTGAGGSVAVGAKGKASPDGADISLPGFFKGFIGIWPFLKVAATAPALNIAGTGGATPMGAKAKAGVSASLSYPGARGFHSFYPFISVSGRTPDLLVDLGSTSVGAKGKAAPSGETVLPLLYDLVDDTLEVFALAKSGVAGTLELTGAGPYLMLNVSVGAKGFASPVPNIQAIRYGWSVLPVGIIGALGKATVPAGNIFQPIAFNLGILSVAALAQGAPFIYAIGQPAVADFAGLESGAYGMPTTINIWNMALSHIGSKHFVESETENSREVSTLKIHWAAAVNKVLADRPWTFARKYASLGLVSENPNGDWAFAYRYPADCVFARRIVTETVGRRNPDPPPFTIGQDNWGRLIYTDWPNAVLEYTMRVFETERYDPQFTTMLSWYLAHLIANPLSRMANAAGIALGMYKDLKETAAATAFNESQQDDPQEAEWIQGRA